MSTLLLAACDKASPPGDNEATAEPVAATPSTSHPASAAVQTELAAVDDDNTAVAVDEPLPPFEDGSGILMICQSTWRALDTTRPVSGEILVYAAPDGSRMLRLENLSTPKEMGLDLMIGSHRIGPLKGPSGNMNYLLDSSVTLDVNTNFGLVASRDGRPLATAPFSKPVQ